MLDVFLTANREELIARCRAKVEKRPAPRPTDTELRYGIPLFLNQLIAALQVARTRGLAEARKVSFALSEIQPTLRDSERAHIVRVLDAVSWNKKEAARVLEISRGTLYRKIVEYSLEPETRTSRNRTPE